MRNHTQNADVIVTSNSHLNLCGLYLVRHLQHNCSAFKPKLGKVYTFASILSLSN